jgi:hypothetical protein
MAALGKGREASKLAIDHVTPTSAAADTAGLWPCC